jgi:hypothetical protein
VTEVALLWLLAVGITVLFALPVIIRDFRRAPRLPQRRRLRLLWEPRDMWVGVYREPARRRTYICPIPGVVLLLAPPHDGPAESSGGSPW